MMHASAATISTVVVAVLAVLGMITGGLAWFYRRGRQEQSLAGSVDRMNETSSRQIEATDNLAAQVGGLRDTLQMHGETLVEHHWRIRALEQSGTRVTVEKVP